MKGRRLLSITLVCFLILYSFFVIYLKRSESHIVVNEIKEVEAPPRPTMKNYPVKGVDISKFQEDVDFEKVKLDGYSFVFAKATEGEDFFDKRFAGYLEQAQKAGILMGAYHFYRLCEDGEAQVKDFISVVTKNKIDLPPVLDVELYRNCRSKKGTGYEAKMLSEAVSLLAKHYNKTPIIYTTIDAYSELREFFDKQQTGSYILFVRVTDRHVDSDDYTPIFNTFDETEIRKIFARDWIFWQACDVCKVNGIKGDVDVDYFRGSLDELKEL